MFIIVYIVKLLHFNEIYNKIKSNIIIKLLNVFYVYIKNNKKMPDTPYTKCEFCNNLAIYGFKDENKARFCNTCVLTICPLPTKEIILIKQKNDDKFNIYFFI